MIHPFGVTGFNRLTALHANDNPTRACRPFDRDRGGFVLGEGAGMVILEALEHAKARGAQIWARWSVTVPRPTPSASPTGARGPRRDQLHAGGLGRRRAGPRRRRLHQRPRHRHHGERQGETQAIKQVFGPRAYKIPMSSTKSMMGHLIAAAGATEMIFCLLAIRDNVLPPTINYETPDPECDLDYVPNTAREARCDVAMTNSFGFGGQNLALICNRFEG